jgi:Flp pilus assembly protein TadD
MAEQRVYLASAGLFLALGAGIARLEAWRNWNTRRVARLLFRAIVVAVLGLLSMHTLLRNAVWGNPVMLFSEAVDRAPTSWHAQILLGEALHDAGRHNEAIGAFMTALQGQPGEPAIYGKLGLCLIEVGDTKNARAAFEKLRALSPRSPDGTNGLGALALMAGQPEQARALYDETLLYDPLNVPARVGLSKVEELQGNAAAALRRCEEIRELAPETPGNDECLNRNRARPGGGGSGPR